MTTRWWAPAAPRVGPDAFDLQLLEAGSDSRLDLANALVAFHRVGAAACEAARDESQLVANLVAARAQIAPPVVESVSKHLDGGTPYAALLVRDLADDAEQAVLDLYRSCVARGVPPTLSAQRAGAVFGVPAGELTQYRTLATTPGASPVAIADAADKVLFSFVEKVLAEEYEAPLEEVSKARPEVEEDTETGLLQRAGGVLRRATGGVLRRQTEDDPQTPYYDARDEGGRFATTGVLRRSELGQGKSAPATVGTRGTRKTRATRAKPQVASAQSTRAATRGAATRTTAARRTAAKRLAADRTAVAEKVELNLDGDESWADIADPFDIRQSHRLGQVHTLYVSLDELAELQANGLGDAARQRVLFRLGHLRDHVKGEMVPSDDSEQALGAALERAEEDTHVGGPLPLDPIALPYGATESQIQAAKDKLVAAYAEMVGISSGDPRYRDLEQLTDHANDMDYERLVVYLSDPADQDMVEVHELVFEEVYGDRNDRGRLQLDPNQPYMLTGSQETFIDTDPNGRVAKVVQHRIRPVTDQDVANAKLGTGGEGAWGVARKADDPRTPFFDNRDTGGRFAVAERTEEEAGVLQRASGGVLRRTGGVLRRAEKPAAAAGTRGTRRVRRTRAKATVERPAASRARAAGTTAAASRRAAVTRAAAERVVSQWDDVEAQDFDVYEETQYAVFGGLGKPSTRSVEETSATRTAQQHRQELQPLPPGTSMRVSEEMLSQLTDRTRSGMDAVYEMANLLRRAHFEVLPVERSQVPVNLTAPVPERSVRTVMERMLEQDPELQHLVAYADEGGGGYTIYRHQGALPNINVVEVQAGFDKRKPAVLVDAGLQRHDASIARAIDRVVPDVDTNMGREYGIEVVRPTVRRWVLSNDVTDSPMPQSNPRRRGPNRG